MSIHRELCADVFKVTHSLIDPHSERCDVTLVSQSCVCLRWLPCVASCGQLEYSSLLNRMHYDESESIGDSDASSMADNGQLGGGAEGDMGITAEGVNVMEIAHKLIHLVSEGMPPSHTHTWHGRNRAYAFLYISCLLRVWFGCGVQVIHSQHLDDPDVRSKLLETTQVRPETHTQEPSYLLSHWLCFPVRLCLSVCVCVQQEGATYLLRHRHRRTP